MNEKMSNLLDNLSSFTGGKSALMNDSTFEEMFGVTPKKAVSKVFRKKIGDGLDISNPSVFAPLKVRRVANPHFDSDKTNDHLVFVGIDGVECDSDFERPRTANFVIFPERVAVQEAVRFNEETISRWNDRFHHLPLSMSKGCELKSNKPVEKEVEPPTPDETKVVEEIMEDVVESYKLPEIKNEGRYYFPDFAPEIADSILHGEHVYIYGPAGCGKSSHARMICRQLGLEPYEVDFSSGVDEATFLGTKEAVVDEHGNNITRFQYGLFPKALMEGRPIIINEVDMGQPQYLAALHGVLEESDAKLMLMDNGAEVIYPQKGFVAIVTANTVGAGEDSSDYSGTNILNKAFLDRFTAFFEYGYSPQESKILRSVLKKENFSLVKPIMNLIQDIRKLKADEQIDSLFSTRRLVMFGEKINRWGLGRSINRVIIDRLETDERELWEEVIQRHFTQDFIEDFDNPKPKDEVVENEVVEDKVVEDEIVEEEIEHKLPF